ncbi:MAG: hypothetical protein HYX76_13370 [Acidobacteria bacterium]|nr:hypothetical protein [Acidobacteriota bacterium]
MSLLLGLILAVQAPASTAVDASKLALSAPVPVAEVDMGKLKGEPARLAWSPDATELYLQTVELDRFGNPTTRHYVLARQGGAIKPAKEEPQWAARYWAWKSGPSAPGNPGLRVSVDTRQEVKSSTANPMGGAMARGEPSGGGGTGTGSGGGGISVDEATVASNQSHNVVTQTMRLKGEVIGKWVNARMVPGTTFGWAPSGWSAIVFAREDGRIVVMDGQARRLEIAASKDALLPAWSDDGKRVAYLQRTGKKKFVLYSVDVTLG